MEQKVELKPTQIKKANYCCENQNQMQKSCEVAEKSQENLVDPGKVPPRKRDVKLTNKEEVRQLKVI